MGKRIHLYSMLRSFIKITPAKMNTYAVSHHNVQLPRPVEPAGVLAASRPMGFASALAHEVRNPLCNINLAVEMLSFTGLDPEQRQYVDIITRGAGRIKDLINFLLLSSQTAVVAPEAQSLHQLLDEVLAMAKDRIKLKNIEVCLEYTPVDCEVLVDKGEIKIALTNIITNAIDAMPSEGGRLTLGMQSHGTFGIVEIRDNGIGISQENLKKIFKPYFTNKPGGMGLGLSTTLDILRTNRVRVDVRSEEGVGTSFILSFDKTV